MINKSGSQPTFICSKLTMEALEKDVNFEQFELFIVNLYFTPFSSVAIVTLGKQMLAGLKLFKMRKATVKQLQEQALEGVL